MLLGTLGANLLGHLLTGKNTIKAGKSTNAAGEGTTRADQNFQCRLVFSLILKYKNIIKTNINLMVFDQEIIYLK